MPTRRPPKHEREFIYREALLARLSTRVAAPNSTWPTVRCWTARSLGRLIREIRDELAADGIRADLTHRAILTWLSGLCLLREIKADGEAFHVLEIGAPAGQTPDPLELLMAARPLGVICYFSAVAFHGLTTQRMSHHHVATTTPPAPRRTDSNGNAVAVPQDPAPASHYATGSARSKLGKVLFRYEETPYYVTQRSTQLTPGVKLRDFGPRTNLRITSYEQTLLDTLYKPFHCGGPEVVFEAWRVAIRSGQLDEECIADCLQRMCYPATTRRVAVMLELIGHTCGRALGRILDQARDSIKRDSPYVQISLFPGVGYKSLDPEWLVLTP